jgi:hypothetical protein
VEPSSLKPAGIRWTEEFFAISREMENLSIGLKSISRIEVKNLSV